MRDYSLGSLRAELNTILPEALRGSKLIEAALQAAFDAHSGQTRESNDQKETPIPYIVHPVGVAKLAAKYWQSGFLPDDLAIVVSAALTHDVLEDSAVTQHALAKQTSKRVAEIVAQLTKPTYAGRESSDDRNLRFVEQIRSGGETPVFIKVCDILHNLSRPNTMPSSLLEKTLKKATGPYRELFRGYKFESLLAPILSDRVSQGEVALERRIDLSVMKEPESIDAYLKYCLERTKGKVLEAHDIASMIATIRGVIYCQAGPIEKVLSSNIVSKFLSKDELRETTNRLANRGEARLEVTDGSSSISLYSHLMTSHFVRPDYEHLTVLVDEAARPSWFGRYTFIAIVSVLAERLSERKFWEIQNLEETARELKLDIDLELALRLGYSSKNLKQLRTTLNVADFLRRKLLVDLDVLTTSAQLDNDVDRIESRTKSSNSAASKLYSRKLNNISLIDDLVGLRIVMISSAAKTLATKYLMSALQRDSDVVSGTLVLEEVRSTSGYCATHIRYFSRHVLAEEVPIGCEIQLRTLYEDAWARVSQALAYKRNKPDKESAKKLLAKLTQIRNDADQALADYEANLN